MNLSERDLKYIWHPCSQMKDYEELPPIVIDHAKGVFLYDENGKDYIDTISSWWCNLVGHCNPVINQAIKDQLDKLEHVLFANFTHEGVIDLAESLSTLVPLGLAKFNFSDNGSSSVECGLKLAFQYQNQSGHPEKTKFMCLTEGYHGETIGALSVGSMDLYAKMYKPMLMDSVHVKAPDCYRCTYGETRETCSCPCFEHMEKAFAEYGRETAAVIVEPIVQGSAGMRIYPPLYLSKLRKLCDQTDTLLIADEIATGFGRTGTMFACDHAKISPDIMCMSKGLTGGYMPMAITATTQEIYDAFYDDYNKGKAFMHSHTYSGNALGCAAANATLKVLEQENILQKANRKSRYFNQRLLEAFQNHLNTGEIRSIGLINAIEFVLDRERKTPFEPKQRTGYQIYKKGLKNGILLKPLGDVIYFNPPLTITESEIDLAVDRCVQSVTEILG